MEAAAGGWRNLHRRLLSTARVHLKALLGNFRNCLQGAVVAVLTRLLHSRHVRLPALEARCPKRKQNEEGQEAQEAAGGRTGSSRRKDKRQQEEGQETPGRRTRRNRRNDNKHQEEGKGKRRRRRTEHESPGNQAWSLNWLRCALRYLTAFLRSCCGVIVTSRPAKSVEVRTAANWQFPSPGTATLRMPFAAKTLSRFDGMFTPSGSLAEISHDGTPEAISAIARATTGRDGVRAKLTDHLERFLCFVKAFRRNDKRQQEEGQEAAGGRTRSSRRKDKRQPTTCPSSCYNLTFLLLMLGSPGSHILCPFSSQAS